MVLGFSLRSHILSNCMDWRPFWEADSYLSATGWQPNCS